MGLGLLACNSSERLVADRFDAGRNPSATSGAKSDVPAPEDGGPRDVPGLDGAVCPTATLGPIEEGSGRYTVAWTFSTAAAADAGTTGVDARSTDSADSPSRCVVS